MTFIFQGHRRAKRDVHNALHDMCIYSLGYFHGIWPKKVISGQSQTYVRCGPPILETVGGWAKRISFWANTLIALFHVHMYKCHVLDTVMALVFQCHLGIKVRDASCAACLSETSLGRNEQSFRPIGLPGPLGRHDLAFWSQASIAPCPSRSSPKSEIYILFLIISLSYNTSSFTAPAGSYSCEANEGYTVLVLGKLH